MERLRWNESGMFEQEDKLKNGIKFYKVLISNDITEQRVLTEVEYDNDEIELECGYPIEELEDIHELIEDNIQDYLGIVSEKSGIDISLELYKLSGIPKDKQEEIMEHISSTKPDSMMLACSTGNEVFFEVFFSEVSDDGEVYLSPIIYSYIEEDDICFVTTRNAFIDPKDGTLLVFDERDVDDKIDIILNSKVEEVASLLGAIRIYKFFNMSRAPYYRNENIKDLFNAQFGYMGSLPFNSKKYLELLTRKEEKK